MSCHCHLDEQIKKFKAGKLGLLGSFLIVGHLLFHVAECLLLPIIIAGFSHQDAEAITELNDSEVAETTLFFVPQTVDDLHSDFFKTLEYEYPLKR